MPAQQPLRRLRGPRTKVRLCAPEVAAKLEADMKTPRALPTLVLALMLVAVLSATALARGGGGSGGGGGPAPTPTPTPTADAAVSSVSVSPSKVAYNTIATGTVRLTRAPASPLTVSIANDSNNSPVLAMTPQSVTITSPSTSATFPVQGGTGLDGRTFAINLQAFTAMGGASTRFFLVPFANTDLIDIPLAEITPNGDIKVQATTDTSSAVLTASFNGVSIPLRNNGGGNWSGQAKVAVTGANIIVRSNLGGCEARSPFRAGAAHLC